MSPKMKYLYILDYWAKRVILRHHSWLFFAILIHITVFLHYTYTTEILMCFIGTLPSEEFVIEEDAGE